MVAPKISESIEVIRFSEVSPSFLPSRSKIGPTRLEPAPEPVRHTVLTSLWTPSIGPDPFHSVQ
jgi:hypothetical protein